MDSFVYSINATVPVFLVMLLGGVIKKLGIIDDHFANVANRYVFKVALPVLLFRDLSKSDFKSQFEPKFVLYCSIVTILMFSLVWIFTELLMKDDTQKGAFIQGSCRSSAAILGMAFVQNMYSDTGMAPLMIVAAVPLFNIFAVVVLTFKAHPEKVLKEEVNVNETVEKISNDEEVVTDDIKIKKTVSHKTDNIKKACVNIAKNPIIIGIVLGFISSMLGMKYPVIVNKTIESIAQTATPIALICIGAGFEGRKAIKKLKPTISKVITGLGNGAHFRRWGFDEAKIIELDWNEKFSAENLEIYCLPARHFSGRGLTADKSLWASYLIKSDDYKLYAGGDSGYGLHYKEIGDKFGQIDIALLDSGQYDKNWKYIHEQPHQVIQAARDLNTKNLLPVHNSKFTISNHPWYEPLEILSGFEDKENFQILTPKIGEPVNIDSAKYRFDKWWKSIM